MSLGNQILRICTVTLAIGLSLLAIRGVPRAQAPVDAVCAPPEASTVANAVWIDPNDAQALMAETGTVFVDCRSSAEFERGHIATAVSLPSDAADVPAPIARLLAAANTIVAYCDAHSGCESSHRLAARLRERGYPDVRILRDGMPGWIDRGYPAESGPCRVCNEETL